MDLSELPVDILQKILSCLTITSEQPSLGTTLSRRQFVDTKEAVRTSVLSKSFLQASSTLPDLNFSCQVYNSKRGEEVSNAAARHRFVNHVNQILTRYQQHNIFLRTLRLDVRVQDVYFANRIEELICQSEEYGVVQEIYLNLCYTPHSNLVKSIFSHKKLVSLSLLGCCDLTTTGCEFLINCSSLRTLELTSVAIDQCLLDKLFHSCPLIEGLQLSRCCKIEAIRVANLPNLKRLDVYAKKRQTVDVNVPSLELMLYGGVLLSSSFSYLPNIESTQNLKGLCLYDSSVNDRQLSNLIANCHVLEQLILHGCYKLENIKVSSPSLSFLSLKFCDELAEVNFDAPILTDFEFVGDYYVLPSLAFTSRDSLKRKSTVTLTLYALIGERKFRELNEFLKSFKSSDNISITIHYHGEFSFDNDIINNLRDHNTIIPQFEKVFINVTSPILLLSAYSSLMEGLLASFSPKILVVKKDANFVKYLCKELLLVKDEDDNPSSSTCPSQSWRNYFKQVKLDGIDEDWQPLHSWKSMEDVLKNLEDLYILKLSDT